MTVIINFRFTVSINYHNSLHLLWSGRGMVTANLEVNLIKHITAMRKEVLYASFLNLNKVYDNLYRSRCVDILEGSVVGSRALYLRRRYWERLQMVERMGGGTT